MKSFRQLTRRAVVLEIDNIDTDQIIPGRFLTTTSSDGLGEHLFADWRVDSDGQRLPDFPLHQKRFEGAEILIAGHNFGCGSSREHAVWALVDGGFRVVISTAFADIFHANALRFGLVAVQLDPQAHRELLQHLQDDPTSEVSINLEEQLLQCRSLTQAFDFDAFAKHRFIQGIDELGYLLNQGSYIAEYEHTNPARICTRG